jgi:hypothetical protein
MNSALKEGDISFGMSVTFIDLTGCFLLCAEDHKESAIKISVMWFVANDQAIG